MKVASYHAKFSVNLSIFDTTDHGVYDNISKRLFIHLTLHLVSS